MVLLAWDGPRWAADYMFGNDIDGVGQESTVPTIAAHLIRPWTRIIVQLGHPRTAWQRQDVELAADVAHRLREGDDLEVVGIADLDPVRVGNGAAAVRGAHQDRPRLLHPPDHLADLHELEGIDPAHHVFGDGLEDRDVHGNPSDKREQAIRMAVNVFYYAMTR